MGPLGSVPSWISAGAGAVLLLLLAGVCRRRGLPALPLRLALAALVAHALLPAIPPLLVAGGYRQAFGALDDLLLVYAGIQLLIWAALELPGGLGWFRRPPDLLLQLLNLGGCALGTVVVARQVARLDLVGLVPTSAVLTAVIGLAAQEPLKDLLAGLELQLSDDFNRGDLLELENGMRGVVDSVTWRDTTFRTMDGALVVVPNTQLTGGVLRNLSISGRVSDQFEVGLAYDFPPGQARALLRRVAQQHPRVLEDPAPAVRLKAFGESAINYELQVWLKEASYRAILELRSDLLEQIWYALQREGQSIPYPVREVQPHRPSGGSRADRDLTEARCRQLLAANPLFSALSEEALDQVVASGQTVSYAAGEAIVEEGAQGESLYQVLRGRVSVLKRMDDGQALRVAELGPGQVFGEMTLFQDTPRSATVRALVECRLLRVGRSGLRELMEQDPTLLEKVAALVSERRAELESLSREQRREQSGTVLETMKRLFLGLRGS
ncbi:MAG: mechanosensitive ion channel family protein [Cyanobacteriota bacterium]|nr:mechanosensitive ion channel family protein [Cyanobacteriota bacterium]